ncbi:MAG TPA: SUMF1/EgtB/PvdO family nonheme iron enzyme [Polyangiaceae bacterium]|nr:SUMF1/EgtB/PvdO family nonheme iron enzyme [Polyangiaceae bacterium]
MKQSGSSSDAAVQQDADGDVFAQEDATAPVSCNPPCPSQTPVCDPTLMTCKVCTSAAGCASPTPVCDMSAKGGLGQCISCLVGADCKNAGTACDLASRSCRNAQACDLCANDNDCGAALSCYEMQGRRMCAHDGTSCQSGNYCCTLQLLGNGFSSTSCNPNFSCSRPPGNAVGSAGAVDAGRLASDGATKLPMCVPCSFDGECETGLVCGRVSAQDSGGFCVPPTGTTKCCLGGPGIGLCLYAQGSLPIPGDAGASLADAAAGGSHTSVCGAECSCKGMNGTECQGQSCCAAAPVSGCVDCAFPAGTKSTIADFVLDKYEVTVGRFRNFVSAYTGPPLEGAGKHPMIGGSGWQSSWNGSLPADATTLAASLDCSTNFSSWAGNSDQLPMNCVNWYMAFAFCAWDGGRLPTESEWQYATAGGSENRPYPWGTDPVDSNHALYGFCPNGTSCNCCSLADLLSVGSKQAGAGKWGHEDLAGSLHEWTLDWYSPTFPPTSPCNNCANLGSGTDRAFRGGGWFSTPTEITAARRNGYRPEFAAQDYGFRCAR